jgi:hypothetical protein
MARAELLLSRDFTLAFELTVVIRWILLLI